MGLLSGAREWWEEWQLRILMLSSLCVQLFLFFSAWARRVPALRRLKVVVRMAYIGGEALAIYTLAALLNRHKQRTKDVVGEGLEVMWAPVLLIHIGGHSTLGAFRLEDNDLWFGQVITLGSQVSVALYIFCKWWSGEQRLLLAAVVLFIFGILKFSLKPWALRRASTSQMLASTDVSLPRGAEKKGGNGETGDSALSLDEYVTQANMICTVAKAATSCGQEAVPPAWIVINHTDYFVDLSAPYGGRLSDLRCLRYLQNLLPPPQDKKKKKTNASFVMLQKCFEDTFTLLYTRKGFTGIESLLVLLLSFLALASVVLFATSHKHGYNNNDIKVTYILFSCTAMLEFLLPLCSIILLCIPRLNFLIEYRDGWHDMVSQYNLMSFYVRKKKPTILMKLAFFECLRDHVSKVCYIRQVHAACEITELVQQHIEDGWKTFISDAATYRSFSDLRGQLTLKKHQQLSLGRELWDSLRVPFDKSVLLWHIATNLCFHRPMDRPSSFPQGQSGLIKRSMEMSNYMFYLLFIRIEMLLPSTRPGYSAIAKYDLELILKNIEAKLLVNEEALAQEIIKHTAGDTPIHDTLIHEACRLAVSLMDLHEEGMWEIIQGVWVEMLCYSASRCRGYLHAKSLGEGGEYLSYVWLLWSYMGMETLADKIQKPQSPEEQEIIVVANELASPSHGGLNRQTSTAGIHSPV